MSQTPTTFLDELTQAARGFGALITGNRQAASFFDFSQRGLIGSLIALVVACTVTAFGPQLFGMPVESGTATRALVLDGMFYLLQIAVAYIVLRQMGREDGFMPFLVADNWATFFTSVLSLIVMVMGIPATVVVMVVGLLVLIVEINIARLIVTLSPMQIAMFIVAQLVGSAVGLMILVAIMPDMAGLPPV